MIFEGLAVAVPADIYARFARARAPHATSVERALLPDPSTATPDSPASTSCCGCACSRRPWPRRARCFRRAAGICGLPRPISRSADFCRRRRRLSARSRRSARPRKGACPMAGGACTTRSRREASSPSEPGSRRGRRRAARSRAPGKRLRCRGAIARGSHGPDAIDAGDREEPRALGPALEVPARLSYDPGVNAQLGAAYLRQLLDQFGGSQILALAAYNGGPTRIARTVRENPANPEDEIFESIPYFETRDYVRRVLLYAESYRDLYPPGRRRPAPLPGAPLPSRRAPRESSNRRRG